jgi:hypothetical protein
MGYQRFMAGQIRQGVGRLGFGACRNGFRACRNGFRFHARGSLREDHRVRGGQIGR